MYKKKNHNILTNLFQVIAIYYEYTSSNANFFYLQNLNLNLFKNTTNLNGLNINSILTFLKPTLHNHIEISNLFGNYY